MYGCKVVLQVTPMFRWWFAAFVLATGFKVRHLGFCLLSYKLKPVTKVLAGTKHKLEVVRRGVIWLLYFIAG